ncbi:hypothetical protein [Streptomyces sp. NPDC054865]
MPFDHSFQITPDEMTEIFVRLQPYLPKSLQKVEPHPSGYGLRCEFIPFTGREAEPVAPPTHTDPTLSYVSESENATEHLLRQKAGVVLSDIYEKARREWKDAAYVAALQAVVRDTGDRWTRYQQQAKALQSAYDYLRTPDAAREWPSAVTRLIDAQDHVRTAALAYDERAREIAKAHSEHLYADLGQVAALEAAGYPAGKDWPVADAEVYDRSYHSDWDTNPPLEEQVRRIVEQQDAHLAKVGRLSGTATNH